MFKTFTNFSIQEPIKIFLGRNPARFKPRNYKKIFFRLIVTLILVGLLTRLNLNWFQIGQDLSRANLAGVLASVFLIFPIIGLKGWRWKIILENYRINLNIKEASGLYGLGLAAGSVTPGQTGDFIKALTLQERGYSLAGSMLATLVDRLFDMFVLALLALGGLLQLGTAFYGELPLLLSFLALVGLGIVLLAIPRFSGFIFNNLLGTLFARKFSRGKFRARLENPQNTPPVPYQPLSLKCTASSFFLTLLTAGLAVARTWLLAVALGMDLPAMNVLAVSSLATIASLLPITIGGIGVRDITLLGLMARLGYASDYAVSLSTLLLLVNLCNFPAGYIAWFANRPAKTSKGSLNPEKGSNEAIIS